MKKLVISQQDYSNALQALIRKEMLSTKHIEMIKFHYHAANMRTTTREIGAHLGYQGNGANGLIGSFSVMISEELDIKPVQYRKADNSPMWFSVIYDGEKPKDEHFTFEMRSEFAAAVKELGLVD